MSSQGKDIHFLKKIEEDSLRSGQLRIPRSFVNKCWEGISNPLVLVLPNGAEWEVQWKKVDADVWLIDDWKRFADFSCLDEDHILVFKHVGQSRFEVVIFVQNGLEMEYPLLEATLDDQGHVLRQRKRTKSPLPCSPFTKRASTNSGERGRINRSRSEESAAFLSAQAFRSHNPSFVRVMRPSYIERSLVLSGKSAKFITEIQRKEEDSVTLRTSEDKTWDVNFCLNRYNGQISLTAGWKNFVTDNNLKSGDACVFEKIKSPGILFRVHIYRDREESSYSKFPTYENGAANPRIPKKSSENDVNLLDDSESESPRVKKEVAGNDSTLSTKANPNRFFKESPALELITNDIVKGSDVTLRIGERSWRLV